MPTSSCVPTGVAKIYNEGDLRTDVLHDVSFHVRRGETVSIVGASGTGKSTLLHILGGLDKATGGEVEVEGQTMSRLSDRARGELRNRSLGFIYQFHHLLPEFTALENVCMPLLIRGTPISQAREQRHANCSGASGSACASGTSRANSAAASASVPPWRVRWSRGRPACSATSRPAISTRTTRRRSTH